MLKYLNTVGNYINLTAIIKIKVGDGVFYRNFKVSDVFIF